jgi:ribosomal protein L9
VLYVPTLDSNLLSVPQLVRKKFVVHFSAEKCIIATKHNRPIIEARYDKGLYSFKCLKAKGKPEFALNSEAGTWHQRLGHLNQKRVADILEKDLNVKVERSDHSIYCETCAKTKLKAHPFPDSSKTTYEIGEAICSDIGGPYPKSIQGFRYHISFCDIASGYKEIGFLTKKSEAIEKTKEFVSRLENRHKRKQLIFRTDNGGEYCNHAFNTLLKEWGTIHQKTVRYTPQQNGIAERYNQTLWGTTRALLDQANMVVTYWVQAMMCACYLHNRTLLNNRGETAIVTWTTQPLSIDHLKTFGCVAWSLVPKETRKKWEDKSEKCCLMGYGESTKGYLLMNDSGRFFFSRSVTFHEKEMFFKSWGQGKANSSSKIRDVDWYLHHDDIEEYLDPRVGAGQSSIDLAR